MVTRREVSDVHEQGIGEKIDIFRLRTLIGMAIRKLC